MLRFSLTMLFLCLFSYVIIPVNARGGGKNQSEASSSLLKVHKLYTIQPPHDMKMYSLLEVSPNGKYGACEEEEPVE